VHMVAIRRPTTAPHPAPGACYVASTQPTRTWIARVPLTEPKDLLDLDIEAIASGVEPRIGDPVEGPFYAVCTHGKRDACCAANGRPVQRALERMAPGRVWESTHLGGHRFAANVLVLPEGVMYGRVDQAHTSTLVETHTRGAIVPPLWRGRSTHPRAAQAAEWFARRALGLVDIDAVTIEQIDTTPDVSTVSLRAAGRPKTVVVEQVATGCARLTGCAGDTADPGRWRLVWMS
jgi:(2Fe-2S) ferredoxin